MYQFVCVIAFSFATYFTIICSIGVALFFVHLNTRWQNRKGKGNSASIGVEPLSQVVIFVPTWRITEAGAAT